MGHAPNAREKEERRHGNRAGTGGRGGGTQRERGAVATGEKKEGNLTREGYLFFG